MTTLKARCSDDKKASSSESGTDRLSEETTTSEFAVTFVRKRYFLRSFGSDASCHRPPSWVSHVAASAQAFEGILRFLVLSASASL
jgi:hypothetical protein